MGLLALWPGWAVVGVAPQCVIYGGQLYPCQHLDHRAAGIHPPLVHRLPGAIAADVTDERPVRFHFQTDLRAQQFQVTVVRGVTQHDVSGRCRDDLSIDCPGREDAFIFRMGSDAKGIVPSDAAVGILHHLVVAHIKTDHHVVVVHRIGAFARDHNNRSPRAISHRVVELLGPTRKPARAAIGLPAAKTLIEIVVYAFLARGTGKAGLLIAIQIDPFANRPRHTYQTGVWSRGRIDIDVRTILAAKGHLILAVNRAARRVGGIAQPLGLFERIPCVYQYLDPVYLWIGSLWTVGSRINDACLGAVIHRRLVPFDDIGFRPLGEFGRLLRRGEAGEHDGNQRCDKYGQISLHCGLLTQAMTSVIGRAVFIVPEPNSPTGAPTSRIAVRETRVTDSPVVWMC